MDTGLVIRIISSDICFAEDIKGEGRIEFLFQLLDGVFIAGEPVICFIVSEGLAHAADE